MCPDDPGPAEYDGCPDTDGDGVHDGIDKCPNTRGPAENDGCPVGKEEVKEILNFARRAVQCEVGSAVLQPQSLVVLDEVVRIVNENRTFILIIDGNRTSTGY